MVEAKQTEKKGRLYHLYIFTEKKSRRNRNRGLFELNMPQEKYVEELKLFHDQIAPQKFFLERERRGRFVYYSIALTKPKYSKNL